ncbi:hypothetical protein NKJ81_28940 [Mesorhizobium sp. M0018]|uniref:hypothetical protein n=1 Tax=Mesorhizobium sp. M0018 TaxID=2956844 RepID=UPI0033372A02
MKYRAVKYLLALLPLTTGTMAVAEEGRDTLFEKSDKIPMAAPSPPDAVVRVSSSNNTPVDLVDNKYATLCEVTITPRGGDVKIEGHAVLQNLSYSYDEALGSSKNNITVRAAIRILDADGHHVGVSETGGPAVDVLNSVFAQWFTVQPMLYYRAPAGVPITFEVAAVTSYHPYYHSGKIVANNLGNPCYISATDFPK